MQVVTIFVRLPTAYQILWLLWGGGGEGGGLKEPPQISWKESFWTLYCYRPFVTRDMKVYDEYLELSITAHKKSLCVKVLIPKQS